MHYRVQPSRSWGCDNNNTCITVKSHGIIFSQEYIFEEIIPTKTYSPQSRTMVPAFNVLTHTSSVTNTLLSSFDDDNRSQDNILLPYFLPPVQLPPSTSYTTITITKVSTITSDVTSDILITLGGRPVRTEYVVPTTMVFHIALFDF